MAILAADAYHRVNGLTFDVDALCTALRGLFEQRITGTLLERGLRHDLVAAALSGGPSNTTIVYCAVHRAEMLQQLCGRPDFVATVQTAARVANILRSADAAPRAGVAEKPRTVERAVAMLETEARQVHAGDLAEPTEVALYEAAFNAIPRVAHAAAAYDFEKLYGILGELSAPVAALFDAVLVMAEEPAVRRNRLALLAFVDGLFKTLADFTKVVTA
jgi:glycyl-tRNA synthetase beta chain